MIELVPRADGVLLPVRAQPGARQNGLRGEQAGALKIGVTAPPEKGKANEALLDVLCAALGLRRSQVRLVAGATARQKQFLIADVPLEELRRRIEAALANE